MTFIKFVIIYIITFELCKVFIISPIIRYDSKIKTKNELDEVYGSLFFLIGLGRILEIIGIIASCIVWLFF